MTDDTSIKTSDRKPNNTVRNLFIATAIGITSSLCGMIGLNCTPAQKTSSSIWNKLLIGGIAEMMITGGLAINAMRQNIRDIRSGTEVTFFFTGNTPPTSEKMEQIYNERQQAGFKSTEFYYNNKKIEYPKPLV